MGSKHQNKRRGVRHEIERRQWTNAEIDVMLDDLLPLDNLAKLHLTESRIAEKLNRGRVLTAVSKIYGARRSRKPIDLALWKLASGYKNFGVYIPGPGRLMRDGRRWTKIELRILAIAFDPKHDAAKSRKFKTTDRVAPPSVDFIAGVLARPPVEVIRQRAAQGFAPQLPGVKKGLLD